MRIYRHRINTLAQLEAVPPGEGIELDLRSDGQDVLVTHDPHTTGPRIEDFLPRAHGRPCILNVKCEGIEERVRETARASGIEDYFFLDLSVPAAMRLARAGETRIAVRYSEVEPIEAVLAWAGRARWVWIDCFTAYPGDAAAWDRLRRDFALCLVSPELQGHVGDAAARLRDAARARVFDAVCTKDPAQWRPATAA
jgi:hypothetical protein